MMATSKYLNTSFAFAICVIGLFVLIFPPLNILSYDVFGYYLYLPLSFNYGDLTLHNYSTIDTILSTYHSSETFYQGVKLDNGNWVMKYTMGMSVLYAPFYAIGHLIAKLGGYATDGFSSPYQYSILYGCYVYTVIGLYYFKKVLSHFFSDKYAAIVFLVIVFGTNYFFHVSIHGQGAMSHNTLFTLYAMIVWYSIKWHQSYHYKHSLMLGICIGLSALVRPTEIIAVLIPLLYGVKNWNDIKSKWQLIFKTHRQQVILMMAIILIIVSYQLFYWKLLTGKFLYNSYGAINPGEGFEFFHPFVLEVLFSFRKGWFIYTPVMFLSVVGLIYLYKQKRDFFYSTLFYTIINLWIVSAWSCWWYAGSFSSRSLIPSYVVLSIPLGYLLVKVLSGKLKYAFTTLLIVLVSLNLFQSWQVKAGILNPERMSRAYYKSIFLQTTGPTIEQEKLLLVNKFNSTSDTFTKEDAITHQLVYAKDDSFEAIPKKENYVNDTIAHIGKQSIITGSVYEFSPAINEPYEALTQKSYAWIKASVWIYTNNDPDSLDAGLVIHMSHKDYTFKYRDAMLKGKTLKTHQWNKIELYYMTPDLRTTKDLVKTFFWNRSKKTILVDDLKLEVLEPINDKSVF